MSDNKPLQTGRDTPPEAHEWIGIWVMLDQMKHLLKVMKPLIALMEFASNKYAVGGVLLLAAIGKGGDWVATFQWIIALLTGGAL